MLIRIRTEELRRRGEGMSVLTAQSNAAREKKLAANNPKNKKNSATTNRGRKTKNRVTYSCRPRIPSALIPSNTKPSHAIQNANRLTSSVDDGSAVLLSSCVALATSESLSNFISRIMLRKIHFRTYAISQPTSTTISMTKRRGKKRANSRISSCVAWVNSFTIISRIVTSLPSVPNFHQRRLQPFARQAKVFDILLYLFARGFTILDQKCECPSAIQRSQC